MAERFKITEDQALAQLAALLGHGLVDVHLTERGRRRLDYHRGARRR